MVITAPTFTGFRPEAIEFLVDLAEQQRPRLVHAAQGATTSACSRTPMEALVAAMAERFAAREHPAPGGPEAIGLPHLPRHAVLRATSRRTRPTSPRRSRGWRPGPDGLEVVDAGAHANGGYFNFRPGDMYVGGGMWMPDKARLDAFRRAIVDDPDRVRSALEDPAFLRAVRPGHRARAPQAGPAGPPGRPPDGGALPLQGRRVRATPLGRRGPLADAAGHPGRRLRGRDARLPVPRDRPGMTGRMRFGAAFWINRFDWPTLRDACLAVERAGWDGLWVGRPPARGRGRPGRSQAGGLGDPRGAGRAHGARPSRPARRGQHLPFAGPDRQARDDRRPPVRRPVGPRPWRRLVRRASTTRSASTSARGSASGSIASTRRRDSSDACSTASE